MLPSECYPLKVYNAGQKHLIDFCTSYSIEKVLPVSHDTLCYFVSFLAEKGLSHSTIKSYLAAVRSMQIDYGLDNSFDTSMPRLDRVMSGSGEGPQKESSQLPRRS